MIFWKLLAGQALAMRSPGTLASAALCHPASQGWCEVRSKSCAVSTEAAFHPLVVKNGNGCLPIPLLSALPSETGKASAGETDVGLGSEGRACPLGGLSCGREGGRGFLLVSGNTLELSHRKLSWQSLARLCCTKAWAATLLRYIWH